ncbi:MAG: sugar phosphate isomerase/epimerase [Defluviitaleaceae bacterium]|nr:sugar phosphate isomerase/epimerase [Defluviitaleaceae bacterium]
MIFGAQLYTIREHIQTPDSFRRSMKKISDIGFTCVQMSGAGAEISIEEQAETCGANGLEIIITHTAPDKILHRTSDVIREHKLLGAKYVGIGMIPASYKKSEALSDNGKSVEEGVESSQFYDFPRFFADFAPAAREINAAGLQFMYHNHAIEFARVCQAHNGRREHVSAAAHSLEAGTNFGGKPDSKNTPAASEVYPTHPPYLAMDYILDNHPEVSFTLDTYWVQAGGADPAAWIHKLAGRVPVLHLKDFAIVNGEPRMAEVFEGNMNWPAIFSAAAESGVKYGMIEQDDCYGKCPFECLALSLKNIKTFFETEATTW